MQARLVIANKGIVIASAAIPSLRAKRSNLPPPRNGSPNPSSRAQRPSLRAQIFRLCEQSEATSPPSHTTPPSRHYKRSAATSTPIITNSSIPSLQAIRSNPKPNTQKCPYKHPRRPPMKTPTTQALHTAALTGLLSLTILSPATAADFTGSLKGVTITDAQASNKPPTAAIAYSINDNTVTFDASGSTDTDGSIATYKWDFGDNSTSTGLSTSHSYATYGDFQVTLTVVDNGNAVAVLQKNITYGAPIQPIGTSTVGTTSMANIPNHVAFHKLSGTASSNGKLLSYVVSAVESLTTSREINIALYTHDAINNKPLNFVAGSDCGWIKYSLAKGSTFECTPSGAVTITAGEQYWIGVRGKNYGGILGNSSSGTYYDYYLGETSSWKETSQLSSQTTKTGTAGILQIKVSQ